MADPIVSFAALAWVLSAACEQVVPVAEKVLDKAGDSLAGVAGNIADRRLGAIFHSCKDRLAGISGPAENHDIAKALRLSQFQALERVIRDHRKIWQTPQRESALEDCAIFFDKALRFCTDNVGRCRDLKIKLNLEINKDMLGGIEGILGETPEGIGESRRERFRAVAEEAVLAELADAIHPVRVPEPFADHFRAGGDKCPPWIELYGAYVTQQIKDNERFRNTYVVDVLLQVKGLQIDQVKALALMDERFGTLLDSIVETVGRIEVGQAELKAGQAEVIAGHARLESMVSALLQRQGAGGADDDAVHAELERLNSQLAATAGDLTGLLRAVLEQPDIPAEKIPEALAQAHKALLVAREDIGILQGKSADYPELGEYLERAAAALDSRHPVDLEQAQQAMAEARLRFREAVRRNRLRDAETEHDLLLREAQLASARLRHDEAARLYREAASVLLPEQQHLSASALNCAGLAQVDHADIFGGVEPLRQALVDYALVLSLHPRGNGPEDWATTQNNRAGAQQRLGERLGGEEGLAALRAAIAGYEAALEVCTRLSTPGSWAAIQNNRGMALRTLGSRLGGEDGFELLRDAIAGCEAALEVYTQLSMPVDWALTQHHRALALASLGEWLGGEEGVAALREAIGGYEAALKVYTRQSMPAAWAATQNNRAGAQQRLGERLGTEEGLAALREAIASYEAVLEVYAPLSMPVDWAAAQNNRALALQVLGERLSGEDGLAALRQAIGGYEAALKVYTRQSMPAAWATAQNNRGLTLTNLGQRLTGKEGVVALRQAIAGFDLALEVRARETMPADWAMTRNNDAIALTRLGNRLGGEEGLAALRLAIAGFDAVLEVCTRASMPMYWATTQNNRSHALASFGERLGGEDGLAALRQAIAGWEAALPVFTPGSMPYHRNQTLTSIERARRRLRGLGG